MQRFIFVLLSMSLWLGSNRRPANFLRITVTAERPVKARVVWRPHAGVFGSTEYAWASAVQAARRFMDDPDSLRRWQDPAVRDSVPLKTPAELLVDMTGGPITIEALDGDSVVVQAQLTPDRGPRVSGSGHLLVIDSDGRIPSIERVR